MAKKIRITGRVTRSSPDANEVQRLNDLRKKIQKEFPPAKSPRLKPAASGLAGRIRAAREAQGLTWYAVAKQAGVPNPNTVRDMELGRDVLLSNLEAVAKVLGLQLELVECTT